MAIKFQCPDCASRYTVDEKAAGSKVTCKKCGKALKVPAGTPAPVAAGAGSSGSSSSSGSGETISFSCDGCGKTFKAPASVAGKKVTCKACGQKISVPSPDNEPDLGPPPVDIYGLDEEAGPVSSVGLSKADLDGPGEEVVPQRVGSEPLSAAKKKKIAERAKKIDKTKTSFAGAGMGASLGAIVVFALISWRVYRIVRGVTRVAVAVSSAAAADDDEDMKPLDPKAIADASDKAAAEMIAKPSSAEAREWLDPKHQNHVIMEMDMKSARELVEGFYKFGAEKVYILEPEQLGANLISAEIAVKLPADKAQRQQCLIWEAQQTDLGEADKDLGQKYILISTD